MKSVIVVSLYAAHRDARFWHDPDTFSYKRHLHGGADSNCFNALYCPFSLGPRTCALSKAPPSFRADLVNSTTDAWEQR